MKLARAGALACAIATACTKPDPRATLEPAPSAPPPAPVPAGDSGDVPKDAAVDGDAFEVARPVGGKSIGHTSVVFKLKLEGGAEAAWKPRSVRGKARYRGEIAAYRLGLALGIPNVPPATPRWFSMADLRAALGPSTPAGKLLAEEAVPDATGTLAGALIPWIHDLRFLSLEAEPARSEWRRWLALGGKIPEEKTRLALQISDMIVFDYLTGNWDRWSGGNIGADATGQTLLFIDNDGAFFDPPPAAALARQRALLNDDARFSRRFVAALRALDADASRAALGDEAPGEPLLTPRALAGLEERRRDALGIVDGSIAKEGEDKALAFE